MEKGQQPIDSRYLLSDEQINKFFERGRQLIIGCKQPPNIAPQSGEPQFASRMMIAMRE